MSDKPGGIPGPPENEDGEVDLGISLPAVANIIDAARASEEAEDDEDADTDPVGKADPEAEDLETQLGELNDEEQCSLIALAWVGRGDYEPDEWEEALNLARERHEADPAGYLTSFDLLGDLLAEGLAAFGIVVEEIER
ncbi:DUF3775 domain-containing protein [Muricoccus aerilatus]|uniref:DUF3775 domain-containing protein n=1 Tax=Muricoccus aerilatus TaxID=452982 RepID=UPI0005C156A1|nr:DUF3775 domain-containing protein [Roseomonas aerilata]